jgi:hypothetical protein
MATEVKIDVNGKGGPACSYNVDLAKGCSNGCVGCYAAYTSMLGHKFHVEKAEIRTLNEKKFRNSCKSAYAKGVRFVRCGKHTDCCTSDLLENFKSILKISGEEGIKLVVVSKSLVYDKEIADLMKKHGHILHMSIGMNSKAQSDNDRFEVYKSYKKAKVISKMRIIDDVTKKCMWWVINTADSKDVIVTPMRYRSKADAETYKADLSKYEYKNGYYRPLFLEASWSKFTNFCGEVDGELKCCKCLTS